MTSELRIAAEDFLWSAWGELGVQSPERRSIDLSIDIEPLIALTQSVGVGDPRLLSTAARWVESTGSLVSKARLKHLGISPSAVPERGNRGSHFEGVVTADVTATSAIQLRVRSALGVSARAEIVRQVLIDPPTTTRSASDLARLCGYSKRNIEKSLDALERSGWLRRVRGGSAMRWTTTDHQALSVLFSPVPTTNTSFMALTQIIQRLLALEDGELDSGHARSALAHQILADARVTADWGSVRLPEAPKGSDAWTPVVEWMQGLPESSRV